MGNWPDRGRHEEVRLGASGDCGADRILGDQLRHSKFAGLRDDKDARAVTKEHAGES